MRSACADAASEGLPLPRTGGKETGFLVTAASHLHFEGLTFRNTDWSGARDDPDFPVLLRSVVAHNDTSHFHDGIDHAICPRLCGQRGRP